MHAPLIERKEPDGDQGQELKEEHGEEASPKNAEGEASGETGQEVAARDLRSSGSAVRLLVPITLSVLSRAGDVVTLRDVTSECRMRVLRLFCPFLTRSRGGV